MNEGCLIRFVLAALSVVLVLVAVILALYIVVVLGSDIVWLWGRMVDWWEDRWGWLVASGAVVFIFLAHWVEGKLAGRRPSSRKSN